MVSKNEQLWEWLPVDTLYISYHAEKQALPFGSGYLLLHVLRIYIGKSTFLRLLLKQNN